MSGCYNLQPPLFKLEILSDIEHQFEASVFCEDYPNSSLLIHINFAIFANSVFGNRLCSLENIHKLMDRKSKLLPTLEASKSKTRLIKDKLKIEDLLMKNSTNRKTHKDYRNDDEFSIIKANNFISRVDTIDSPNIIFAISDQIKEAMHNSKEKENISESCELNKSTLSSFRYANGFQSTKNTFHKQIEGFKSDQKLIAEERESALELARWLDEKLSKFRVKHTVSFLDILEYKQTILNYALGKIIDSLSRRCKEEGQILSLIWDSTFKMFESVFNVLVQANKSREKENTSQAKELHQIFETNHNFLREQNGALLKENNEIFEKMKNVILWNKRLRKERKALNTSNRILQYRNATYGQALEETLKMLLQSTPDPVLLQTAKKIILKLGKEKNRKKHPFKQEVDNQIADDTRTLVCSWLKNNNYLDEEKLQLFKENCFTKEDGFIFSELDDINDMKKVDIYDFFKLYDVGIQAAPQTCADYSQCEKKGLKNAQVMTKNPSTMEYGCQTVGSRKNSNISNEGPLTKKKVQINVSTNKQANSTKYKKQKSKTPVQPKDEVSIHVASQKQRRDKQAFTGLEERSGRIQFHRDLRKRSANDYYLRQKFDKLQENGSLRDERREDRLSDTNANPSIIQAVKLDQDKPQSEKADNTSISELLEEEIRTRGLVTTKNIITNNSQIGRQRSLVDFIENNQCGSSRLLQSSNMGTFKRREHQKRSVAYIRNDIMSIPLEKLNTRQFNEVYKGQRDIFENNKVEFVDQLIRRRSFFTKRSVQFANFREAEEVSQRLKECMRGTRYGNNSRKIFADKANLLNSAVDRWTKRGTGPSNIAKSKALTSAKGVFESITASIQQIARIPPKNKVFVNNSLSSLAKYISDLVVDYLKQIKREKEVVPNEGEKALYPLNLLLMERMTFKYGLKDIAEKKIKHFIEKVLTFSSISQKISLYSLLLGLDDSDVGSDQLLVYLKCLVYFQDKKPGRDTSTESNLANIELVRENLRKILQYFFDNEYINLVELKLEIYFQQSAPYTTVQGISLIIIHELLKRKKQLRLRYSKVHSTCTHGDNFFTNVFQLLKMASNYRDLAMSFEHKKQEKKFKQAFDTLKQIKSRTKRHDKTERKVLTCTYDINKISESLRQLLKRSDIMDEEYGKSITEQRFITAAMLLNLPNAQDLETILNFMRGQFEHIKSETINFNGMSCDDFKSLDKLARTWNKSTIQGEGDPVWGFAKIYAEKVQQQVFGVMGKLGSIGTAIQNFLFNFESN